MDSDSLIKCPTDFFGAYINISHMLKTQPLARTSQRADAADKVGWFHMLGNIINMYYQENYRH